MNKPDHSTQRASEVVQDDLSSCAADTSMSNLLSKSPDESATPIFANSKVAFWKTCSKSPILGQCGSDTAPISSMIASGKRSERVETSGKILPPCIILSRFDRLVWVIGPSHSNSSTIFPSSSTTLANLQS